MFKPKEAWRTGLGCSARCVAVPGTGGGGGYRVWGGGVPGMGRVPGMGYGSGTVSEASTPSLRPSTSTPSLRPIHCLRGQYTVFEVNIGFVGFHESSNIGFLTFSRFSTIRCIKFNNSTWSVQDMGAARKHWGVQNVCFPLRLRQSCVLTLIGTCYLGAAL